MQVYTATAPGFPPGHDNLTVFERGEWLASSANYVRSLIDAGRCRTLVPEPYVAPVPVLIAGLLATGPVRVLDLGGGVGPVAAPVLAMLPADAPVTYVVVDGADNCVMGRQLFAHDARVQFDPSIPPGAYDFVVMSSALQYITDWRGCLDGVLSSRPRYLYLGRLPRREAETVAVRQPLHSPTYIGDAWHWVFGPELAQHLAGLGYVPAFDFFIRDLTGEMAGADPAFGRTDLRVECYRLG